MSTSHYSSRDYTNAPGNKLPCGNSCRHTDLMREVISEWDEQLAGEPGMHTVRIPIWRERLLDRVKLYLECVWLFIFTSVLILFDASGIVYFWGEAECWVFAALVLPAWALLIVCLRKISSL
jgi:hypothetical protein